jgi:hypothetical protein
MLGSYLNAMSDPPSWTSMTGSENWHRDNGHLRPTYVCRCRHAGIEGSPPHLPSPDPTSSESRKGTQGSSAPTLGLTGSGSRFRASQCNCSTMVLSPSGERARRRVDAQRRRSSSRSARRPPRSLARSGGEERRGETKMKQGFLEGAVAPRFCCRETRARPLISDGWLTTCWARFSLGGQRESRPRPLLL